MGRCVIISTKGRDPRSAGAVPIGQIQFTAEEGGKIVSAPVEDFKCERTPLRDALDLLAKVSKQEIVVDWPSMSLVGVSKETPVFMHIKGMPLGQVFGC